MGKGFSSASVCRARLAPEFYLASAARLNREQPIAGICVSVSSGPPAKPRRLSEVRRLNRVLAISRYARIARG